MKLDKNIRILIIGLGLIGGSYAMGFSKRGYRVNAIDTDPDAIRFALEKGLIEKGASTVDPSLIGEADLCSFALYPHVFVNWIRENQD